MAGLLVEPPRAWSGFASVAFAIDACTRRIIVDLRVSRPAHAGFVQDVLEQRPSRATGRSPRAADVLELPPVRSVRRG
jgi:hypothetical protein